MAELKATPVHDEPAVAASPASSPVPARRKPVPASPAPVLNLHLLLELDAHTAERLRRDAASLMPGAKRPLNRTLRQVFWDTDDHALARAGLALGLQTLARRKTQLIRDLTPRAASRIDWGYDQPLTGDVLDVTRLAFVPGADPALVASLSPDRLVPAFGLDIARAQWKLDFDGTQIAATLDTVEITASEGRAATLHLLDLALTGGSPDGIFRLVESWVGRLDYRLATRDAVQQGDVLARGAAATPGTRPVLSPAMSVRDGFLSVARQAASSVRRDIAALGDGLTVDAIHQARVALRRLRSLLSVFRAALPPLATERLAKQLNRLARDLGQIREWDVLLAETLGPLDGAIGPDPGLEEMIAGAREQRARVAAALPLARLARDMQLLSLEFSRWFDAGLWPEPAAADEAALLARPLAAHATELLSRRHRRLIRSMSVATTDAQHLHAVRIEAKKLRYTAELLSPLFPARATRKYLSALRAIQEILGVANDAAMARVLIPRLVAIERPAGARAFGLITGWTAAEAATAQRRFADAAAAFGETRRFWR